MNSDWSMKNSSGMKQTAAKALVHLFSALRSSFYPPLSRSRTDPCQRTLTGSSCPFYLRKVLAGTPPVCPAFESIALPNRLTHIAHTADYIPDGYLGGKHLKEPYKQTVRRRRSPLLTHSAPATVDWRARSTEGLVPGLVVSAVSLPSNDGDLEP